MITCEDKHCDVTKKTSWFRILNYYKGKRNDPIYRDAKKHKEPVMMVVKTQSDRVKQADKENHKPK